KQLIRRFDRAPKPMCYQPEFLKSAWQEYCTETGAGETEIDPDDFVRWAYARALAHRQPRYRAMAGRWGITLAANDVARVNSEGEMVDLIGRALEARS
ncbi:MAG: ATPase, partial [Boseongicola sp.]